MWHEVFLEYHISRHDIFHKIQKKMNNSSPLRGKIHIYYGKIIFFFKLTLIFLRSAISN